MKIESVIFLLLEEIIQIWNDVCLEFLIFCDFFLIVDFIV